MPINPRHDPGQQRQHWPPEPDFFRLRLTRGGWPVAAAIVRDADGWHAVIDGTASPPHPDPALAPNVERIWTSGYRIPEHEYHWMLAARDAAPPDHPSRDPRSPIHPNRLRPLAVQPRRI